MNHFFFLAWLEWTVLDYDDFIILRISFRIFASLFINEIDFIWFWPQTFMKHHHYLIFSNRKKKLAKVLFLRAIYRDSSFSFFFGIDSFLISISSHATFLKSLLYCSWFKCCVNFCSAAKWFSYTYIHILFHILFCYGLSQDIDYGSPSSTIGPFCFRVTSAKLYMSFSKRYLLKFSNFLAYNYAWFSVILRFPFYCCCYPLLLTTGFGQDPNRK